MIGFSRVFMNSPTRRPVQNINIDKPLSKGNAHASAASKQLSFMICFAAPFQMQGFELPEYREQQVV